MSDGTEPNGRDLAEVLDEAGLQVRGKVQFVSASTAFGFKLRRFMWPYGLTTLVLFGATLARGITVGRGNRLAIWLPIGFLIGAVIVLWGNRRSLRKIKSEVGDGIGLFTASLTADQVAAITSSVDGGSDNRVPSTAAHFYVDRVVGLSVLFLREFKPTMNFVIGSTMHLAIMCTPTGRVVRATLTGRDGRVHPLSRTSGQIRL